MSLVSACIAIGGLAAHGISHAQYPTKPIRFFVPIPPGGAPDVVARVFADRVSPLLGQPVVVETRAGSGGNIATDLVARAAPDGYTVMIAFDAMIVINPHMYSNMKVDTMKDQWLPTEADTAYVKSLMQRVVEPGKMAAWIAPPDRGIIAQAIEYQYVKL